MAQNIVVRLELSGDAKKQLATISKRSGMTQLSVASRLFEWFAKQSELIHGAVLSQYPKEMEPEIASVILKHFHSGKSR